MAAEFDSTWFSSFGQYGSFLQEDWLIRQAINNKFGKKAGISLVKINRKSGKVEVNIFAIRPANILGRDNNRIDELTATCKQICSYDLQINVLEAPFNDAQLIAEKIAIDLERRTAFRRSCKTAISKAISAPEVLGIKVTVSGRLNGAEIARTEWYLEGKVPLHTWHANISNGFAEAETTYGIIGVKVVLNKTVPAHEDRQNSPAETNTHNKQKIST